jgi:hypothetical protein
MPTRFVGAALRNLAARMGELEKKGKTAVDRAKATVGRRIKPEARRQLQAVYNLPAGKILDGLKSRTDADSVELTGSGKGVNITSYGATWRGPKSDGVAVKIKRDGPKQIRPGSFIAKGANSNRVALEREMKNGKRAPRYPLKGVYGPSIAQQLKDEKRGDELAEFAQEVLSNEIDRLTR